MDEKSVGYQVIQKLIDQSVTISTAESFTGGLVAAEIISVPGVSKIFSQGYITYSDEAKNNILGVSKETLLKHTAVSRETAYEMALGCAKASSSHIAIATTGYAGPDGGPDGKPAGLCYIACYFNGMVTVKEYNFKGNREQVRSSAVNEAMLLLQDCIVNL